MAVLAKLRGGALALRDWFLSLDTFWRGFIAALALLALVVTLTGCKGAAAQIAQDAAKARESATIIDAKADEIRALAQTGGAQTGDTTAQAYFGEIDAKAQEVKAAAANGLAASNRVSANVPNVKDVIPWWGTAIQYGAVAVAGVVVFVLLWQSGALAFVRGWLGLLSPKVRAEGKLAAEALQLVRASDSPSAINAVENLVTAKRATTPEFDAAYRKAKGGAK